MALLPGSPCYKNQGYCDHFHTCRLLDADGPIARLKNSFLNLRQFDDMADWMKVCVVLKAFFQSTALFLNKIQRNHYENNLCNWSAKTHVMSSFSFA